MHGVTVLTLHNAGGTRIAAMYGRKEAAMLTFRCRFCHAEFGFEESRYPFIWSSVLTHLVQCSAATDLTTDGRSAEAELATDAMFDVAAHERQRR